MLTAVILLITNSGCTKSDSTPTTARKTTYSLMVKDVLGITGTATFTETSSTLTTIDITLPGAP